jgi:hypothetical protein
MFGQVLLLEDESGQGRAQELNCWLVELMDKDLGIEIGRVVLVLTPPPEFGSSHYLGNFENKGVTIPQVLLVGLENLVVLGGLAVLVFEWMVKGEVDFQDREMFEVFGDAVHREDFFNEGIFPHHLAALLYPALIAFLGLDLPQPAGVPVTGHAHSDLGIKVAEEEFLNVCLPIMGHDPSLTQKAKVLHFLITRTYQNLYRKSDKFRSWQVIKHTPRPTNKAGQCLPCLPGLPNEKIYLTSAKLSPPHALAAALICNFSGNSRLGPVIK